MGTHFVNVSEPGTAVGDVVQAAQDTGATHALVVEDTRPVALVHTGDLSTGDHSPIEELADRWSLDEVTLQFERPGEQSFEAHAFYADRYVIVLNGDQPLLVTADEPLRGDKDVQELLASSGLEAFSPDISLPDPRPNPPSDLWVTYICERGDHIPQLLSDTNRICPLDGTLLMR